MSTEVATYDLSREKIELIKQTVAKGSTDLELDLFLHACKRTGLDPLMKQIYAIKRWNGKAGKEEMSIQTGIDGYRLIADRTGQYAGSDEPIYKLEHDPTKLETVAIHPDIASVTVYKLVGGLRCAFSASARWEEYVQLKDGKPTSMWAKMPYLMLAKCAEALALRKAFPAELSGVYTHEEMMQADSVVPEPAGKTSEQKFRAISNQPAAADGLDGASSHDVPPPPVSQDALPPQPAAFIWQITGKHKGESIATIDSDYLNWFSQNGKRADHVEAANLELDRRRS